MLSMMLDSSDGRNGFANRGFDQVAQARGLFDAGAGFGAEMQIELAGVGDWEEVAAEPGDQKKGGGAKREKRGNEDSAAANAGFKRPEIARAHRFKAALESALETRGEVPGLRFGGHDAWWASAGTSRAWAPGFARDSRRQAWRTPPLQPAGRTDSAPRRSGRTSG